MDATRCVTNVLVSMTFAAAAFSAVAAELPPLPTGLTAPAKAVRMPAFNLPTAAGGNARAEDYRGKVVIACFWATW